MFLVTSITMLRERTGGTLEAISYALPLTYTYDALAREASGRSFGACGWVDVTVVIGVTLLALGLGALTLRRRTP
jgi:ABC-2 type transport system permease protein